MALKQLNWVLERSPYTGAAFAIHLALADVANEHKDNEVWLKRDELGRKARVKSKSNISKILKQMCDDGMLELVEDNSRSGFNSAQTYRLLMPEDQPMVYDVKHVGGNPENELKKRHRSNAPAHTFREGATAAQQSAKQQAKTDAPSLLDGLDDSGTDEVVTLEVIEPTHFAALGEDSPFDGIETTGAGNGVHSEHPIADGGDNGVLEAPRVHALAPGVTPTGSAGALW